MNKKVIRHSLSFLCISFFLFMAFGSEEESSNTRKPSEEETITIEEEKEVIEEKSDTLTLEESLHELSINEEVEDVVLE